MQDHGHHKPENDIDRSKSLPLFSCMHLAPLVWLLSSIAMGQRGFFARSDQLLRGYFRLRPLGIAVGCSERNVGTAGYALHEPYIILCASA